MKKIIFGYTNRFGGVSENPFKSLNLAFHTGDDKNLVQQNRKILASSFHLQTSDLIFMDQIHSDKISIITHKAQNLAPCDGIITNLSNLMLCVMVADCMPVLVFDEKLSVIGAIHAGKAGIYKRIVSKALLKMREIYDSNFADISLFVGAHIQKSCYELKNENFGEFKHFANNNYFDLSGALKAEISSFNLKKVEISQTCSHCDKNYFSYRRDGVTGRFCGYIMIKTI